MTSPSPMPGMPGERRDFRQEVTNNVIAMLEKGLAPWQKPWAASGSMPMNPTTGRSYRGGNAIHLMATAMQKGYDDPRWATYKQAANEGWQVKHGEKGTQIEFWDVRKRENGRANEGSEGLDQNGEPQPRLIRRVYTVFNASQIDDIPAFEKKEHTPFEITHVGEEIIQKSGAKLFHDQVDRAFYNRTEDAIHLPSKESFKDAAGYYGTALHELAHSTGHPDRLNRATLNESYRFGDLNYAKEELRAELASLFLAAQKGIPHDPESHAAYVDSWIKVLSQDKNEIFRAAHDASVAADYLLTFEHDRSLSYEDKPQPLRDATAAKEGLAEAAGVANRLLGSHVRTWHPDKQSGLYRGPIVAETANQLLQQVSSRSVIAHEKASLTDVPSIGDNVAIAYASNEPGHVKTNHQRTRSQELSR